MKSGSWMPRRITSRAAVPDTVPGFIMDFREEREKLPSISAMP